MGHTLVEMDKNYYVLFGGLDEKKKDGKTRPNNQIFTLKINNKNEAVWAEIMCEGEAPMPRSNHAAAKIGDNNMFVFGGLFSSNQRFNDVHFLKCPQTRKFLRNLYCKRF
jgi:hypothetical protein